MTSFIILGFMKRVFVLSLVIAGLMGCGPSCPSEVKEVSKEVVKTFREQVRLRQANGLVPKSKYESAGIKDAVAFELWMAETKAYLATKEIGALSGRFHSPMEVYLYDGSGNKNASSPNFTKQALENPKDFCKHYQYFMTNELKGIITGTPYDSLSIDETPGSVLLDKGYVHIRTKTETSEKEDYEIFFIFN